MRFLLNQDLLDLLPLFENRLLSIIKEEIGERVGLRFTGVDDPECAAYVYEIDTLTLLEDERGFISDENNIQLTSKTLELIKQYAGWEIEFYELVSDGDVDTLIPDREILSSKMLIFSNRNQSKHFAFFKDEGWKQIPPDKACQLSIPSLGIKQILIPGKSVEIVSLLACLGNRGEQKVDEIVNGEFYITLDQEFAINHPGLLRKLHHLVTISSVYQSAPYVECDGVDDITIIETMYNLPLNKFSIMMVVAEENVQEVENILIKAAVQKGIKNDRVFKKHIEDARRFYLTDSADLARTFDLSFNYIKNRHLTAELHAAVRILCPQNNLNIASLFIKLDLLNQNFPITLDKHYFLALEFPVAIEVYLDTLEDQDLQEVKQRFNALKKFIETAGADVGFDEFLKAVYPYHLSFIHDYITNKPVLTVQSPPSPKPLSILPPAAAQERPRKLPYGMKWHRGEMVEKIDSIPPEELNSDLENSDPDKHRYKFRRLDG